MAYVAQQQVPKEEENQFARKEPTTPYPVSPQGGGSAGTGSAAAPGVGTSTQFGSNAAKLSDYLKANQEQTANFGNQVAGDLTNRYNQTVGSIDQGFGNFNQQVNQGWSQPDQAKIDQAATNPAQFTSNPDNVKNFKSWYNDQYQGPQNFENTSPYADINNQVNKAVENSSLVGTTSGLGSYLNNFMGTQNNTPGMKALDTALLERSPEARTAIQNAAAPFKNLNTYLGGKTQEADTNAANARQQADNTRTNVQNRFSGAGGVVDTFKQKLNDSLQQEQAKGQHQIDLAKSGISNWYDLLGKNNNEYKDALTALGLPADNTDFFTLQDTQKNLRTLGYSPDLNNYLNVTPANTLNLANVARPEDYQTSSALGQLTGQDLTSFLDPAQVASRQPINRVNFDATNAGKQELDFANEINEATKAGRPIGPNNLGVSGMNQDQKTAFTDLTNPYILAALQKIAAGSTQKLYPGGTPYSGPGGPV